MPERHWTEPSSPGGTLAPLLKILVLQQGTEVECSGDLVIRRLRGMHFVSPADGAWMRGPYPDLPSVFAAEGRALLETREGRILEWEGLVLSQDPDGGLAGPYPGFDEWLWMEGDVLRTGPPEAREGAPAGYVHHWRGHYFISVDPFPAFPASYATPESAMLELRRVGRLRTRAGRA